MKGWIAEIQALCQPDRVHICDGSDEERDQIAQEMVKKRTLVRLLRPGSFWCHSHPDDVARVEEVTFICSKRKDDAGPTNNWVNPTEMKAKLHSLFKGCMRGRTMYVIPYCMGPLGSPLSELGVEITDSPYVVLSMKIMTRMGAKVMPYFTGKFVRGVHSVGCPDQEMPWLCNPKNRAIVHFPEERSIWSFGSGYGGNALLGKKCHALRIASVEGRDAGWMAEHMLIMGVTNPEGKKRYFAAAFPSACGKTNLAMMTPTLPGWKVECVGDDIAWMRFGVDGRLYAINPESGYFGVAPGTSMQSNPNAMKTIAKNAIFTNTGLTKDKDVWWEGIGSPPPPGLTTWLGEPYQEGKLAAHPNSRFTVPAIQNPIYDKEAENPQGVPISAIIFGGRRATTMPLVIEARSWQHGVFLGASLSSEMTAAAKGELGKLRHDPFAMLPFCGYNMGDYFAHWLQMGKKGKYPPKIYHVNWFRKDADGKYLWPGFGENSRVIKWMFDRAENAAEGIESPIGILPKSLDFKGIKASYEELFAIHQPEWRREIQELEKYFTLFGDHLPKEIKEELSTLETHFA